MEYSKSLHLYTKHKIFIIMKHLFHLFNCIVILAFAFACSQKYEDLGILMSKTDSGSYEYEQSLETSSQSEIPDLSETDLNFQRKIIKEGSISFETTDAKKTRDDIVKVVNENNGYLSSDNITNYSQSTRYRVTIRVPADNFDKLLEQISGTAKKVDSKEIKSLDVTEEFVDVESRIKTKKELETRYKELLKQANKVDDILLIEKEIGVLRTDIEAFEGRLRYLKDKVAYSTLTIEFYEQTESTPESFGFGGKIGDALYDGWIGALWFFIGLAKTWPFILMIIAAIYIIRYFRKKRKIKRQQKNEPILKV